MPPPRFRVETVTPAPVAVPNVTFEKPETVKLPPWVSTVDWIARSWLDEPSDAAWRVNEWPSVEIPSR